MAHVTTSLRAQDPAESADQQTEKLQSKRSSLRLSGLLNRRKSQRVEADKPEDSEKPTKKDLQVPLYRRYASFRSRTPSARGGSTTPKSVGKDGMASTAEVDIKNLPEGAGVEQTESADQSKKPETAFPTSSDSKVEKPLPEPKDAPSRPRRLSVKVSKILNALPGKTNEKVESDSNGTEEGSSRRRLLVKVGNLVNRKPKATPGADAEPEVEAEGKVEDEAKDVAATEDKDAPAAPPKPEDGITEENRAGAQSTKEAKAQVPSTPPAKSPNAPPPSAANRATKLARRLSAGALDAVFRTKSKGHVKSAEGEAPPVSKASLAAQDLASQPAESEKPTVEDAKSSTDATTAPESGDDKALPPPPADEPKSTKTKEKAPPSAFKDATKVARRLSTGLFKKPNASSPDLHKSDAKAEESTAAESKSVVETPSTTERATEIVRKVSRRAQHAVAKARSKVKVEGKQKPAAPAPAATPAPPAPARQSNATGDSTPAPPAETTAETKEAPAAEKAEGVLVDGSDETNKGSEDTTAAQDGDKELPPPPSSFSLGGLTRRLSGTVSGVFGYGATAETAAPPTEQAATDSSAPAKDDKPTEVEPTTTAGTKAEPSSEDAVATPAPAQELAKVVGTEATPESAPLKEEEAIPAPAQETVQAEPEPASEQSPAVDKALPSPPPASAAESIAKIGKLTRRLSKGVSTRVGSALRSATSHSKGESHSGESDKQTSEVSVTKGKPEGAPSSEGAKPAEGTDSAGPAPPKETEAASPTAVDAEPPIPPMEGTPTTPASPPPGAFKTSRTKLGRRLSARIGDVFRSKAPPVPEKEAVKDDTKPGDGEAAEAQVELDDTPVAEDGGSKDEGESKKDIEAKGEPTPIVAEGEAVKSEEAAPAPAEAHQPEAPSTDEASKAEAEAMPSKPLPAKPSRSTRAKDVAVDVGRQLSIKATGALKAARPKLEEIVAKAPSAFKSSDKGKEKEKVEGEDSDGGAHPDGLGKRISKRVVDGIRGLNHKQGASGSDGKAVKEGDGDEDWEEVEANGEVKSPAVASKPKPEELPEISGEPTSAEDVKGASVEAVEGAHTPVTKDAPKAEQLKDEEAKSGRPLSSLVTGIFKPKHKSELPLPPTDAYHAHKGEDSESKGATTKGKDDKRRRRISLGFGTKKKSKKSSDVKGEAKVESGSATSLPPPAVPPKDGEGESNPVHEVPASSLEEKPVTEALEASGQEKKSPAAEAPESSIDEKSQTPEVVVTTKSA